MDRIHKLPFLLGGFVTVLVGAISYGSGSDNKTIYIRMVIFMVVFYIIGIYARNTIIAINKEVQEKKQQEEYDLMKEKEIEAAQNKAEGHNQVQEQEHILDLIADDSHEEFTPLSLSDVISKKIKE
jgi:capsular polysaccharide biosynthesis protein